MLPFTITINTLVIYCFISLILLPGNIAKETCSDSMNNVFRYSAKHVSKKMAPSVSAVLMECPKTSVAPSCQRKIMLNIRISAEGSTCKKDKYLLLDEIFDQGRKTKARLMSPYLIELSRGEPVLMYPLDFVKNLDCNSCGDKIRKSPNNLKHSQAGSNSLHMNQNAASIINKGSRRDILRKNPQKISVTPSKSENKRLASHEHPSSSQNSQADEIDLDINIALDDEVNNGVGSGSMKSQQFTHEEDHGNTKRNPKMIEKQESLQSDYDETNRDYDAIFEELEKKNEKIKKDILEILKPTLQLCDEADTIGTGLNYRSSSDQQQNCTDPCKCSSFTSGASESQSKANCPTCPPCPSCPTLPPLPARPECGKPDQIRQLNVPASQRHFSPRRTSKFHPSKRTNRREDNVAVKIQKELQNNELPIQETSEDSSEDAESNRRNELSSDENVDVEEAEDVFSSVDEINDDFFQPNLQSEQVEGNTKLKYHSLIPKKSESVIRNPNIPEVQLQNNNKSPFVRSKMQPSSIADFKKYQLDPIRYDGVSKVDRYQSLLGNNRAHLTSNSKGTPSSQKSNRKKDAQFVSYINGYGLNVDSVDVLNETSPDAFQSYQRLSESSMPRLQHYFMHVGTPSCPACNDPLSSIVEIPPANAFRKKSYKKSVPRMCPFGCPFPSYRKLSTSKMSPQRVLLDPGQAEVSIREWSPPVASYSKEIKTPFEVNPTEIQEEPAEMEGSYRSESGIGVKPVQSEESQAQLQQIFPLSSKISSLHGGSNNRFALTNGLSSGDEMLADSKNEGTEVENNPELSQVPFRLNPKFRPIKLSRGFAEKPTRENSQSQDEDGGEEYDYYEEDTSDLSDFPYVLARRPGTKFPSVYQRPVYVPSIIPAALESENSSADFITDEYREPKKRTPPQRRGTKRVIRPFLRGRFLANQEKRDEAAQILLSHIDPNLLTDRVPYDSFLSDPNISVGEKLRLMNVIDPEDAQFEALLKYLETEVQNSHPPYYITKIDREEIPISDETNSGNEDGGHEKNIEKRSFALYDDMEIHDIDVDYEGLTAARHLPVFDSFKQSGSPVAGKHSKRGNKGDSGKSPRSVEDIWYSVFNMSAPLQFLTTRVRVFRKKENSWWRIAPSITLTSLSGIYANANLSIMFSSHVELYNLEKPLHLQDYKLLIPNNHTSNITPKEILAVNSNKFHIDKIETDEDLRDNICEAAFSKSKLYSDNKSFVHKRNGQDDSIHSLEDFGEFPTFMNILEQCKNDPSHLCLNMLDEKTPGYKIKVQIPFRDNSLVYKDYFKVRITSVVVDGTVDGAIQIIVSFINEALLVQDFDVVIADCPVTCGAKNIVHKVAPPHRGVTIAFLLPLQDTNSGSKYTCQVQIRTVSNHIISHRQLVIRPSARCLCIWQCNCHCIKETVSTLVPDMCEELTNYEELEAGFDKKRSNKLSWEGVLFWLILFLILLLLLGCIKAWLGCCIACVDRWKYNYLQPMKKYEEASRCRRFFINTIFFLCFPFVCLCRCFQPSEEDMLQSTANWEYSVVQHTVDSSSYASSELDEVESRENSLFSQPIKRSIGGAAASSDHPGTYAASVEAYLYDSSNDEEERQDAKFVQKALDESRKSMKTMDAHYSEEIASNDEHGQMADKFVKSLIESKIVYRTFRMPLGNASLPPNQAFSIRGYFIPAVGPGYQFITHTPLRQHWMVCPDIHCLRPIIPPSILLSKDFSRTYANKREVYEAGDLSVCPSISAPCINVLVQDISMYTRSDECDQDDEDENDDDDGPEDG